MNREKVLELVREVGAGEPESLCGHSDYVVMTVGDLERFANLVEKEVLGDAEPNSAEGTSGSNGGGVMDERIKELAEQAGFIGESMYPIIGTCQQTALQNFAELIVRECVSVAMEQYDDAEPWGGVQEVLKHFGVKE